MNFKTLSIPLSMIWTFVLFLSFTKVQAQSDTIYIVDKTPQFPGGDKALSEYWTKNFKVPFKSVLKPAPGEGIVHFTIDAMGRVQDVFIKKSLSPTLDAVAITAVQKMPRWEPAVREDVRVAMGYQMSFWVTNALTEETRLTPKALDSLTEKRGFFFGMWTGMMPHTGDLGTYFNPMRWNLGLTLVGYTYQKWQAAIEYDVFAMSRVKKTFEIDGKTATTDMRISPTNFYFPISYALLEKGDWTFRPYLAPTINGLDVEFIDPSVKNSSYETIGHITDFSLSLGLCADKILSRTRHLKLNSKYRYEVGILRTRLNINPMNFSETHSTKLKGTAISLTVGLFGQFLKGKDL